MNDEEFQLWFCHITPELTSLGVVQFRHVTVTGFFPRFSVCTVDMSGLQAGQSSSVPEIPPDSLHCLLIFCTVEGEIWNPFQFFLFKNFCEISRAFVANYIVPTHHCRSPPYEHQNAPVSNIWTCCRSEKQNRMYIDKLDEADKENMKHIRLILSAKT